MEMATATKPWTRADLARLPDDGNRYEVLAGKLLVTPQASVPHQGVATAIATLLSVYCKTHGLGLVVAPGAVPRGENELQPDIQVVLDPPMPLPEKWEDLPRPVLVVEVLSASTSRRDLGVKREAYRKWRIPEYWIVDRRARTVTVVRVGHADVLVSEVLQWHPRPKIPALEISLNEIFR